MSAKPKDEKSDRDSDTNDDGFVDQEESKRKDDHPAGVTYPADKKNQLNTPVPGQGPRDLPAGAKEPGKKGDRPAGAAGVPLPKKKAAKSKARASLNELAAAVLEDLEPSEAAIGSADVLMAAIGTGFAPTDVIVFNGGEEATTFVDETRLTTVVKPSTATVEGAFPVLVRCADGDTDALDFTFLAEEAKPESPTSAEALEELKQGNIEILETCDAECLSNLRVPYKDWARSERDRLGAQYDVTYDAICGAVHAAGLRA